VSFDAFVDADPADALTLESTSDGETWRPVPLRAEGCGTPAGPRDSLTGHGDRCWRTVRAELPGTEAVSLRFRYATGDQYAGRGVYLDRIAVRDGEGTLLDAEHDPGALTANGWRRATR
jgi:hypothetical protein